MHELYTGGLSGHVGRDKTIDLVEDRYFWPHFWRDVTRFVQKSLPIKELRWGNTNTSLYSPLQVPATIWDDISMDFILELPVSKIRVNYILEVVDKFSKMSHLIPYKKIHDANNIATFLFHDIVKFHGIPKTITFDPDMKFMSHFWREL